MIAIYTPYHSNRTKYVLDYIFVQQFGCNYEVLNSIHEVSEHHVIKINYSQVAIDGWVHLIPHGLLNEELINKKTVQFSIVNELPVIFENNCAIGFDLFSAVFFCLSRYEEYCTNEQDKHGRFSYKNSFLHQYHYLQTPLVDYWIEFLKNYLNAQFPNQLQLKSEEKLSVLPTIDIDAVFTYKGKNFKRQLGGLTRDLLKLNWTEVRKRYSVLVGEENDPYDNFEYQFEVLKQCQLKAQYFIQVGNNGEFDKNIQPSNKAFQTIVKKIDEQGHEVGWHPSYQSFGNKTLLKREKEILETIIGRPILHSRQHYLRFALPNTYNDLIEIGIKGEFSMGYSEVPGFRASTSRPFYWYNLETNKATELEIHPFSMMDVAFKEFMQMNTEDAIQYSNEIIKQLREVNGELSFVFHNESLSDYRGWKGWRTVFENWLNQ